MDNKSNKDIAWKEVPKGQRKKVVIRGFIIALCAVIVGLLTCSVLGLFRINFNNAVERITQAEEYVISLSVEKFKFNQSGSGTDFSRALTEEQIESFYSTLGSITFHDAD